MNVASQIGFPGSRLTFDQNRRGARPRKSPRFLQCSTKFCTLGDELWRGDIDTSRTAVSGHG